MIRKRLAVWALVIGCLSVVGCATATKHAVGPPAANLRVPKVFTDNMVLQRDVPVRVWGWADAGGVVKVAVGKRTFGGRRGRGRTLGDEAQTDVCGRTLYVDGDRRQDAHPSRTFYLATCGCARASPTWCGG